MQNNFVPREWKAQNPRWYIFSPLFSFCDRNENISQSLLLFEINIRRLFSSLYVAASCLHLPQFCRRYKNTHRAVQHWGKKERKILIILRSQQTIKNVFLLFNISCCLKCGFYHSILLLLFKCLLPSSDTRT